MASSITRHALRVYAALSQLRPGSADVLDALLPFFEPILELMNGKVFDPKLFALGVQKVYRWRFTEDIAEQFIPRLAKANYLKQVARLPRPIFVVTCERRPGDESSVQYTDFLSELIDEFEAFTPRLNDLLNYHRSRDELTDILIRFLVSLDAYNLAAFTDELRKLKLDADPDDALSKLEEGGRPLLTDERYITARFVQYICEKRPAAIDQLARLASIGLLTEVVEDFMMPVQSESNVSLTIAVDAPLALDYLGCSGAALKKDVRSIFDALRHIGCAFVVFPTTCEEMQRNLQSMLSKPISQRHGYTHDAITRGEVSIDFVRAVAGDPEGALAKVGIQLKPLTLSQMPSLSKYFSQAQYEDFFASIVWVSDVLPREHDATCLALTMRLREARHHSDVFKCGYVFVSRNATFVQHSRAYCLQSRMMNRLQEGAIIHQRHLATLAWLRTGLGADQAVPRGHLLATCDRVLRPRMEVREAVAQKLKEVTPESLEQFELLVSDQRSMRRLADMTLNNEKVVTDENASELLEAMRQATIEEEKKEFADKLEGERAKHRIALRAQRGIANQERERALQIAAERDSALDVLEQDFQTNAARVHLIASEVTKLVRRIGAVLVTVVFILALGGVLNYFTGWLNAYVVWSVFIVGLIAAFGLYHMIMNALERPKVGVQSLLRMLAERIFRARIKRANLEHLVNVGNVNFANGVVTLNDGFLRGRLVKGV
jgi:hypothetical protein